METDRDMDIRESGGGKRIAREGVHNVGHDPNRILWLLFGSFAIRKSVQ